MGLLDAPLRAVSKNLMAKFGTSCTIRSVTHGAYSATAGKSVESTLDTATKGVLEEYRAHEFGDRTGNSPWPPVNSRSCPIRQTAC
jgi:hypothetical protein